MDFIRIDGLELECIVGVRPRERRRPQPVRIDLRLGLDLSQAGQTGRIGQTADYSRVADEVTALLRFRQYQLIEVATEELTAMLLAVHPMLVQVEIRLEKPAALHGRARAASVEASRRQSDFPRQRRDTSFGETQTVLDTHEATLELLCVEAGRAVGSEVRAGRRLEWVVSGHIESGGGLLREGEPIVVGRGGGKLVNAGAERATLFHCLWRDPPTS
jgi:FolB domain-containing protein